MSRGKQKTGDINYVTLFRTPKGENFIKFSYSDEQQKQQIIEQEKLHNEVVKVYDRLEGEV